MKPILRAREYEGLGTQGCDIILFGEMSRVLATVVQSPVADAAAQVGRYFQRAMPR